MKRLFLGFLLFASLCLLVGCAATSMTARDAVEDYLDKYKNNDSQVMDELDVYIENEDFTDEQKKLYKDILIKQYSTLNYEIINEEYDGNTANVTVRISVINLSKAQKEAVLYLNENSSQFNNENGEYDKSKFITYKLEMMDDSSDMIDYNIVFKVVKDDKKWEVVQLSNDDLEKIHGIYSYEG